MNEKVSLTTLQKLIRDTLIIGMPGYYWVTAEIGELKVNYSGHCYLELVEKNPKTDSISARVRATIWAARYRQLKPAFETATNTFLSEGMKVLLKVSVEYHELYGLSLNVSEIDPAYTMGEMAVRRNEIIKRLTGEGVFEMNKELDPPILPQRIAIISSESSAGYTDFIKQLTANQYGYKFNTTLFNCPMQGEDTEQSILEALNIINSNHGEYDLVTIIRGGGSTSDMRWFDNYPVAYHITQFPLPVITGIGHEKDISVVDMVAWKSLKTPTAVAIFLVEEMNNRDLLLENLWNRLSSVTSVLLRESTSLVVNNARSLLPVTTALLKESRKNLLNKALSISGLSGKIMTNAETGIAVKRAELKANSKRIIVNNSTILLAANSSLKTGSTTLIKKKWDKIVSASGQVRLADPINILKKGFTITLMNGKPLIKSTQAKSGDTIKTILHDGQLESIVTTK